MVLMEQMVLQVFQAQMVHDGINGTNGIDGADGAPGLPGADGARWNTTEQMVLME